MKLPCFSPILSLGIRLRNTVIFALVLFPIVIFSLEIHGQDSKPAEAEAVSQPPQNPPDSGSVETVQSGTVAPKVESPVPPSATPSPPLESAVLPEQSVAVKEEKKPDETILTNLENLWASFSPGSWVQNKTVTYTFQDDKTVKASTETKLTLDNVDAQGFSLKLIVAVEMNGKKVIGEPQVKKYDFYNQLISEDVKIVKLPAEKLNIAGRAILCEVRSYELSTPESKRKTKVWYNTTLVPYVLCSETIKTSTEQKEEKVLSHSLTTVLYPPPTTLRGMLFGIYQTKTIRRNTEGTTYVISNCSKRIPGGIQNEQTWEYDREGKLIRKIITFNTGYSYTKIGGDK